MKRTMKSMLGIFFLIITLSSCESASSQQTVSTPTPLRPDASGKVHLSEAEWKKRLSPNAYLVLREEKTETAYTGKLLKNKQKGIYTCGGCGLPLFSSTTKFESGTGWPSFYQPISPKNVTEVKDQTLGMVRVEVECSRCGGHLGHVFEDGPKPTGLRYCMNSLALSFIPATQK